MDGEEEKESLLQCIKVCVPNYRGSHDAPHSFMNAEDFTVFFQTNKEFLSPLWGA